MWVCVWLLTFLGPFYFSAKCVCVCRANKKDEYIESLSRVFMSLLLLRAHTSMIDELLLADRRQINHWVVAAAASLTCDTILLHLFASDSSSSNRSSICKESVADIFWFLVLAGRVLPSRWVLSNCVYYQGLCALFLFLFSGSFGSLFSLSAFLNCIFSFGCLLHCRLMDGAGELSVPCECELWWWWWWCPILVHIFAVLLRLFGHT